ncbi:DNA helicase [Methanocaldococcus vulcanius M7]|uniref:DNA helicase n=1 Tax=Methanocaldococcus vulcanius (strain ATCC 700851 / DSM 12094 / M7) TaxID=579137 RepID=C9RF53_METVM|nr:IGHMBP2 family helicase [Methanocaldococcus vulcanius]ACX72205.1 DNA helicase [Methanocaldococcus vulcanius M7]
MNIIDLYVKKFKDLIEIERRCEMDFHKNEIIRLGKKRENVGRAILNLKGKFLGESLGCTLVRFGRKKPFKTEISPGDVVLISREDPLKSDLYANVISVGKNFIDVAFDEDVPKWVYKDRVRIDLYVNDITFKRMKEALREFAKRKNKLIYIILGLERPEKPLREDIKIKFYDDKLNDSQKLAVKRAVLSKDLYLIHGPPGTGKTRTLTEVIVQEVNFNKHKVLATADSNTAADNILEYLVKKYPDLKVVRVGHPTRISKDLIEHSLPYLIENHEKYQEVLSLKERIKQIKEERDKFLKPSPRWRRGMSDEQILKISKKKKSYRGIPKEKIISMAEWITKNKKIQKIIRNLDDLTEKIINEILSEADVVVSTNSMAGSDVLKDWEFDVVVIDEGSQAMEPSCLIPIVKGNKLIMAGDHKQLPPTVLSENKELKKTLFERLIKKYPDFSSILEIQYRMNEKIMEFPNRMFYDNKLKADESVKNITLLDLVKEEEIEETDKSIVNKIPVQFINVEGKERRDKESYSYYNIEEAEQVFDIVKKLLKYRIPISVITPYDAQVRYLRSMFEENNIDVEVNTVDGFQGRENETIVISFVRTEKFGFLKDLRRLNVAITRPKRKLVLIGNENLLKQDKIYNEMIKWAKSVENEKIRLNQ